MTSSRRHKTPYDTQPGVVIDGAKLYARTSSSFEGMKTQTYGQNCACSTG